MVLLPRGQKSRCFSCSVSALPFTHSLPALRFTGRSSTGHHIAAEQLRGGGERESGWASERAMECCLVWMVRRLPLLMASIIQVPCRQAFRDSLAGGNGSSGPQFQPLIIPLMWQPGKKSSPAGLAPTSPLIIDESRWWGQGRGLVLGVQLAQPGCRSLAPSR